MGIVAEISNALEVKLNSMSGIPDVAWQNSKYEPSIDGEYYRVTNVPFQPVQIGIGDDSGVRRDGLLQIDVAVPKGAGRIRSDALADQIVEHFPIGLELFTNAESYKIRIIGTTVEIGEVVGSHYIVPTLVHYWAVVH